MKFVYEAVCLDCESTATQDQGFLVHQRAPCNACGSTKRKYPQLAKSYSGDVGLVLTMKTPERRRAKSLIHETSGPNFSKSLGRWVWRNVEVDRIRNYYREIVLDPESGEVLHHCEEPLSDHRLHGTAKPINRASDEA